MRQLLVFFLLGCVNLTFAQTADDYYKQAKLTYDRGDYKTALKKIDYALNLDSSNANFYALKAQSLFALESYDDSFEMYDLAIEKFPYNSLLYMDRGHFLVKLQLYDYAIMDFTAAMNFAEVDSLRRDCIINRSAAKISKMDFEGAYDDLMICYSMDSTDLATLTNLGVVCDEIGRGDETLKYLLKALEVDPTFFMAYVNIGFKYQVMGKHTEAIQYFDKVLELKPDEPLSYSNRSFSKLQIGDLKGAMKDIEQSIKLFPTNSYAYRNRALIYLEQKKLDKACEDLQLAQDMGFAVSYGNEVADLQKKYCGK